MKASELVAMADDQLVTTLHETERHLFQLRFQSATDRLETPTEITKAKKDIARIKTEQRRRELAAFGQQPDDAVARSLADLQALPEGPGKRRVTRTMNRLSALQESRAAAAAKLTPTGKGK